MTCFSIVLGQALCTYQGWFLGYLICSASLYHQLVNPEGLIPQGLTAIRSFFRKIPSDAKVSD